MTYIISALHGGRPLLWNSTGWSDRNARRYSYAEARCTLDAMEARGVYGATMQPYKTRRPIR